MQWSDVLRDKYIEYLPYKVELNEWGNIVKKLLISKNCCVYLIEATIISEYPPDLPLTLGGGLAIFFKKGGFS